MPLRGKVPEEADKKLKVLFYGDAGVGKTTTALHFPNPYVMDTEDGTENSSYIKLIKDHNGAVFKTTDVDEIMSEVKALLSEKHDYKTLVIDSFTVIYQDLCDKWATKLAKQAGPGSDGTEFQRHRDKADTQVKQLFRLLFRLDMNVIVTAQSKTKWQKNGKELIDMGNTFDCYKKMDYIFDLALEVQMRGDKSVALVKKTRIDGFPRGATVPFSYDEIADRYGREILEKGCAIEKLATTEQIKEIKGLIAVNEITDSTVQKWLDKAKSNSLEDMSASLMDKLIVSLKSSLNKKLQGEV